MKFWLAIWLLIPVMAQAQGEKLKAFVTGTASFRAHFEQTVSNSKLGRSQNASGEMMFSRPGKFRWVYQKPYEQVIVGDGVKLWVYDPDLNQVTVKNLDQSIGSSPAALLAGENEIEKMFALKDGGEHSGLDWLEATPKTRDANFQSVRMGFSGNSLAVMELRDFFGQVTLIHFSHVERNPRLGMELFKFQAPKGADVIGE